MDFTGKMKRRMQRANEAGVVFTIIVPDDNPDLQRRLVSPKLMATGDQDFVSADDVASYLVVRLAADR